MMKKTSLLHKLCRSDSRIKNEFRTYFEETIECATPLKISLVKDAWKALQPQIVNSTYIDDDMKKKLLFDSKKRTSGSITYPPGTDAKTTLAGMRKVCMTATTEIEIVKSELAVAKSKIVTLINNSNSNSGNTAPEDSSSSLKEQLSTANRRILSLQSASDELTNAESMIRSLKEQLSTEHDEILKLKELHKTEMMNLKVKVSKANDWITKYMGEKKLLQSEVVRLTRSNRDKTDNTNLAPERRSSKRRKISTTKGFDNTP